MSSREQFEQMFAHCGAYLDAAEVEQALGFFEGQIKQWICRNVMPFPYTKIRSRTRIRKDALINWLMENERLPGGGTLAPAQAFAAPATASGTAPAKRRGRPPRVPDMARQAQAQQQQTI